jgi:hypothetical protein
VAQKTHKILFEKGFYEPASIENMTDEEFKGEASRLYLELYDRLEKSLKIFLNH